MSWNHKDRYPSGGVADVVTDGPVAQGLGTLGRAWRTLGHGEQAGGGRGLDGVGAGTAGLLDTAVVADSVAVLLNTYGASARQVLLTG